MRFSNDKLQIKNANAIVETHGAQFAALVPTVRVPRERNVTDEQKHAALVRRELPLV